MRRVARVIGLLLAGLVVLVAAVYVVHGVAGLGQVSGAKKQAVADLDAALATTVPAASAEHDRLMDARLRDPAYSWREIVCELTTKDAGWIVADYVQVCSLRTVRMAPARQMAGDCDLLDARYVEGATPSTDMVVWRGAGTALEDDTHVVGCPTGVTAPVSRTAGRILEGTRPSSLASSPAWVMVEVRTSLTSTILGCDPWAVIFCSSPVDSPVLAG